MQLQLCKRSVIKSQNTPRPNAPRVTRLSPLRRRGAVAPAKATGGDSGGKPAGNGGNGGGGDDDAKKRQQRIAEYVEALQRGGVDAATARKVIDKWRESGATGDDPAALRKLFLKQSSVPLIATLVQTLVDAAAGYSIFTSGLFFDAGPDFFGRGALVFFLNALAAYFALGVAFDIATLVAILASTARVGASPDAFYAALKAVAAERGAAGGAGGVGGAATGLAVVDKAAAAASAVRVAQTLDAIAKMLEAGGAGAGANAAGAGAGGSQSTLGNLSAYLTLLRSEKAGFDPSKLAMSEADAADLAGRFASFDLNDDGRLDAAEVRAMAGQLGIGLSEADARAAIQAMDANGDGLIEFAEWAAWWAARRQSK